MNLCTRFGCVIEQHLIEITACDLIRMVGLRTIAVFEIKLRSSVRACAYDFAAVLFYEPGAQKFFVQPQPGKRLHAEWQQRLADMKPRKLFALEHNYTPPGTREQRRSRAACRAASDDGDIVLAAAHRAMSLANSRDFGSVSDIALKE